MSIAAGLALALASTFALNWGWVVQHAAASELSALSLRHPVESLRALFSDRSWLTGFVAGLGGWALYVAALALAPLSVVQATAAGGLGILALLAHRRGAALSRVDRIAVVVSTFGLVLLALSLLGGVATGSDAGRSAVVAWLLVSVLVATGATLGGPVLAPGAGLGIAAGVLYAGGDVATKAVFAGGLWVTLVVVVLAMHGAAFVSLQLAFQRGRALTTAGLSTLCTNALPIVAGLAVFHEHLPGGASSVLRVAAFAAVVAGAALLTRYEAGSTRMPSSSL
jgi:hypothetical protein